MERYFMLCSSILALIFMTSHLPVSGIPTTMGVCYGMVGNNLPSASQAISLLDRCGIYKLRIYEPNAEVMEALAPVGFLVSIGVRNEDLPNLAASLQSATDWVNKNYAPYASRHAPILEIIVGNEAIPGPYAQDVVPAMRNLRAALDQTAEPNVFVTTAISGAALTNTYPPSQSVFIPEVISVMTDLVSFMNGVFASDRRVYVSVYPYFAYASDPDHIALDYATFQSKVPVFHDGDLAYFNLFDAMYDGYVWAMEKIGGESIFLVVGETGWPSAGNGDFTTPELASIYNTNFFNHIVNDGRSPKRTFGEAFLFALFNENLKTPGVEQHWGLFDANMQQVYSTPFC